METAVAGREQPARRNNDPIFIDRDLLTQAERHCRERLQAEPENRKVLRSLAEVHRKLGNLSAAAAVYDRLYRLDPLEQDAGYLRAVMAGEECQTPLTGLRAAPFVRLTNWL